MSAHLCHAEGCDKRVPPKMLMCLRHWRMVPRAEQAAVWATYRAGQEVAKDPSREYLIAARDAINAVAEKEGRPTRPGLRALDATRSCIDCGFTMPSTPEAGWRCVDCGPSQTSTGVDDLPADRTTNDPAHSPAGGDQ